MGKEEFENRKVGEIVTENFNTASVFKKAGIDFCCGGNLTLKEACKDKKIEMSELLDELSQSVNAPVDTMHNYKDWDPGFLCDYIVNTHHKTVFRLLPQICAYTEKIAQVHGPHHPELIEIEKLFLQLNDELLQHLKKEETVLFPAIKEALKSNSQGTSEIILSEITRMSSEHELAGGIMDQINTLSKNYLLPPDACNTYMVTYKLLEQFEDDLHIHVHIENNILYPKALALKE